MRAIRQILCATDLSPASEPAWDEAQALALACGAELLLFHVVAPGGYPAEGLVPPRLHRELVDSVHREAHEGMGRLLEHVAEPFLKVRSRIQEGSPAAAILDVAREEQADLIVVGTHSRTGLERVALGSVADRVIRQAACPVVTVRAGASPIPPAIRRIAYATDFSATARAAWPWVVTLADATGAMVDLMHVTLQPVPDRDLPLETLDRMARLLHEEGQARAEQFLEASAFPRDRVTIRVGRGVVGDEIVHWARARAADLIVLGTHGRSGLARWMLGSVALHTVQAAPCPVFTVGPPAASEADHAR
jgi:nucleotide-binding universal stress UspA family protein